MIARNQIDTERYNHPVLTCAGCPREVDLKEMQPTAVQAKAWSFRLVPGFGWLCEYCRDAVQPLAISGDIHAETGS